MEDVEGLSFRREGSVATVILDRPDKLNALTWKMVQGLTDFVEECGRDDDLRAIVITGAGRAFCAGADLRSTIPRLMDDPDHNAYPAPPTIMRGQTVTKPLIAAVNGLALGGGLEIVLACDLRIAADSARFGAPEVTLGLIPGWGGTQRLPRQLPWAVAARINLPGEPLTAQEALQVGLVNAVVPAANLVAEARRWGEALCRCGPLALRAAKEAMLRGREMPLEEGLELEQRLFNSLAYSKDVREGLTAFHERRPPQFKGE